MGSQSVDSTSGRRTSRARCSFPSSSPRIRAERHRSAPVGAGATLIRTAPHRGGSRSARSGAGCPPACRSTPIRARPAVGHRSTKIISTTCFCWSPRRPVNTDSIFATGRPLPLSPSRPSASVLLPGRTYTVARLGEILDDGETPTGRADDTGEVRWAVSRSAVRLGVTVQTPATAADGGGGGVGATAAGVRSKCNRKWTD